MKSIIAIFLVAYTSLSWADDLSVIIQLSGIESTLHQTNQLVLNENISSNPSLLPFKDVMDEFFRDNLSFSVFEGEVKSIYLDEFTSEEINSMARSISEIKNEQELMLFYGSHLGQRLLEIFTKVDREVLTKSALIAGDRDSGVEGAVRKAYLCRASGEC